MVLDEGVEEDNSLHGDIYAYYSTHDLTKKENYEEFGNILDIQSYIDFMCANVYLCNLDMYEGRKNFVQWRCRTPGRGSYSDGKWRMMIYDMDAHRREEDV